MKKTSSFKAAADDIALTLLATTDVHGHLLSYDYYGDQPAKKSALSRVAAAIAAERAQNPNVLLVDNGDFLQGTPLTDLFTDLDPPTALGHPVVTAMRHLNYDAAALGNHEFNIPLPKLNAILRQMPFPLLCANLAPIGEGADQLKGLWQGHVILERQLLDQSGAAHTVKIGLFGILPPQVLSWDHSRVSGRLCAQDSITAARNAVHALQNDGADIIIGLAHTGLSAAPETANMENSGLHIAAIKGLDALVLGHSHLCFPGPDQPNHADIVENQGTIAGVPTVMPGTAASHLGNIQLILRKQGTGWKVQTHAATLISTAPPKATGGTPASTRAEDPEFVAKLTPSHKRVLQEVRKSVGSVAFPIHSFLALLPGCNSVRLVAHVQAQYLRDKLAGTALESLPILSAAAPQKCGGRSGAGHFTNIPAGNIALRNIADIQFFPNDVSALRIFGGDISDWLEVSASLYNQIVPHRVDQPLRNDDFPAYNSDTIFGLTYQIDLTQPPRYGANGTLLNPQSRRIKNLAYQDALIDPEQQFVLAVNNYRSGGGGGFPHVSNDRIIIESDTKILDLLAKALAQPLSLEDLPQTPWQFTPIPGASVEFDTGSGLRPYLPNTDTPSLTDIGTTPEGFLRMRLSLAP